MEGVTWKRTGDCCRCGECCESGNPFTGQAGVPCPLLHRTADGLTACSDRSHPYYLSGCNVWPSKPEHIVNYPSCTYRFERVGD